MPKFTKKYIESIKSHPEKTLKFWDSELKGFGLVVLPSNRKTYCVQYRNQERVLKRLKVGVHGQITTEQARELAKKVLSDVTHGLDPSTLKKEKQVAPTFKNLVDEYFRTHAPKKKERSVNEDLKLIKVALKKLESKKIESITPRDIGAIHASLEKTPYMANRTLALLSKMFTLSVSWGWRNDSPAQGIKKYQEHKRTRWLAQEEMDRLWKVLDSYQDQKIANVFRLLLLTGSRKGEVLNATWDQFDLEKGVWTKPAHTTKQKRMEHVPLSSQAIDLLKHVKAISSEGPYLFPGKIEGQPLKEIKKSWATIRKQADIEDVRIHDLRHTYASHLVSSGLSLSIVGKLLGHTQTSTTQRYAHLADEPLREATEMFAKKIGNS